ncbi:MAG TPA: IclR family transcriptional regulator [Candidatus Angelobacter sp.]|nr:IclR family transcriptional regulator [Candidatus Angelobacter sp.]
MSRASVPRSKAKATPKSGGASKSLQKALRILFHVGQTGSEVGVTQLASALGLNKATVYRLLNAMQKFELIEKNPETEKYRLGLKLHELGTQAVQSRTLQSEAHRYLLDMATESGETVTLAAPLSNGVVCLDRVDSPRAVMVVRTPIGARFSAHSTAIGKAVLAYLPERELDAILVSNGLTRHTPFTLARMSDLKENLAQVRHRQFSVDNQERERGLSGIAAHFVSGRTFDRRSWYGRPNPPFSRRRATPENQSGQGDGNKNRRQLRFQFGLVVAGERIW